MVRKSVALSLSVILISANLQAAPRQQKLVTADALARLQGNEVLSLKGASFAPAGDVNGDGFPDILAGDPEDSRGAGRVSVFYGGAKGFGAQPAWTFAGEPGMHLGRAVAAAGDVNGDGFADILVGADGKRG